ncbi:MAG: hypothetical protein LCH34_06885 [Firmicutes bacterium]|nr:hypothetical protein [Bacillota bacterium]
MYKLLKGEYDYWKSYNKIMEIFFAIIITFFVVGIIFEKSNREKNCDSNSLEDLYEERNFPVVKTIELKNKSSVNLPEIKFYLVEKNSNDEYYVDSPLYIEISKGLLDVISCAIRENNKPVFKVENVLQGMNEESNVNYPKYVYIMRLLTNFNFEGLINKNGTYDFSEFDKRTLDEVKNYTNSVIVDIGTNIIKIAVQNINLS